MKQTPILMSGPMIRALLNTQPNVWPAKAIDPAQPFKWQTRRPAKFIPTKSEKGLNVTASSLSLGNPCTGLVGSGWCLYSMRASCWNQVTEALFSPYGHAGDALWVKETFAPHPEIPAQTIYRADFDGRFPGRSIERFKWKPSIFMPRERSRIVLQLVEEPEPYRLGKTGIADILAEGAIARSHEEPHFGKMPVSQFDGKAYVDVRSLWAAGWEGIHGKGSYNPRAWVWVLTFKRTR